MEGEEGEGEELRGAQSDPSRRRRAQGPGSSPGGLRMDGCEGGRDKEKQRAERASPKAKPPTATKEEGRS